jgi:hypothetical protein
LYGCGKCHRVHDSSLASSQPKEGSPPGWYRDTTLAEHDAYALNFATRCCNVTCLKCGAAMPRAAYYERQCSDCFRKDADAQSAAKDAKRYEKAKKVPYEDYDGEYLSNGDEYFADLEAVHDHYDGDYWPEWLWGCYEVPLDVDFEGAVGSVLADNHHEDAGKQITDGEWKELREFGEAWCKKTGVKSYQIDYGTVVGLPPRDDDDHDSGGDEDVRDWVEVPVPSREGG